MDYEKSIAISLPGMKPQLPKAVSGFLKCKKAQIWYVTPWNQVHIHFVTFFPRHDAACKSFDEV